MTKEPSYFFVDETGDLSRFDKKGRSLLGQEGISKVFMVGVLEIKEDLDHVASRFEALRADLLNDPCLKDTPSLRKTKLYFHAKDDCAAVRREVFKLLRELDVRVRVIVKRKVNLINESKILFEHNGEKLSERDIYRGLIARLFMPILHKSSECHILFAQRGKTFNNESLAAALNQAKRNCYISWNIVNDNFITVDHDYPSRHIGLQLIDYYLWVLSRVYESHDDSYFKILEDKYSLIWDLDDTRESQYGIYYSKKKRLEIARIKSVG